MGATIDAVYADQNENWRFPDPADTAYLRFRQATDDLSRTDRQFDGGMSEGQLVLKTSVEAIRSLFKIERGVVVSSRLCNALATAEHQLVADGFDELTRTSVLTYLCVCCDSGLAIFIDL